MKIRNLHFQLPLKAGSSGFLKLLICVLCPVVAGAQIHASSCTPSFGSPTTSCSGGIAIATSAYPFILTGASGSINDATACGSTGYIDNSGTMSCTLNAGTSYTAQISGTPLSGNLLSSQVWIDFNNDGIFESSECVGGTIDYNTPPATTTIIIPPGSSTVTAGTYRMRVVIGEYVHGSSAPSPTEQYYPQLPSCPTATTVTYGECRDYAVIIATPPVDTVSPSSVTFAPTAVSATSPTFNVTFTADYLTPVSGSFTVTAPAGFNVYNGTAWVSSYTIAYTSGTLAATTIPVQFAPASATTATGTLTISGGGITTATVALSGTGAAACGGAPAAGTVSVSPAYGGTEQLFTLTDAGYTSAGGIAFQWMSSPTRSGAYTNITGANTPIYSFTGISSNMYYVCKLTCSSSAATSDTVEDLYFPSSSCTPYFFEAATECTSGSSAYGVASAAKPLTLTGVSGTSINDANPCNGTGYLDLTASMICSLNAGATYSISAPLESGNTNQVWIDFNNNGIFESSESVGGSATAGTTTSITIPSAATVNSGTYRMRVEATEGGTTETGEVLSYPNLLPCATDSTNKHGEARDYRVTIISSMSTTAVTNIAASVPQVKIYPNPAQSVLFIESVVTVNVTVTSMVGSEMLHANNVQQIDLGNLANGIYLVSVYDATTGLKIKTERIAKVGR